MKIIQFLSENNEVLHGVKTTGEKANIIEGDIFEEHRLTGKTTRIKQLLPPVFPPNILAIGLNYKKHADETGSAYPDIPVLFLKSTNTLIGDGDFILIPRIAPDEVDFEAELGVIIGKTAKNVSKEKALNYVMGYTCANDVSARIWQKKLGGGQFARGKSFDTFCPIGPHLVTKNEIENPANLKIECIVNGKTMQKSSTKDMIFDVASLVSNLSQSLTLFPGTLILTGTPEGVGFARKPQVFLKDGDKVTVKIENIGELNNTVKKEI